MPESGSPIVAVCLLDEGGQLVRFSWLDRSRVLMQPSFDNILFEAMRLKRYPTKVVASNQMLLNFGLTRSAGRSSDENEGAASLTSKTRRNASVDLTCAFLMRPPLPY